MSRALLWRELRRLAPYGLGGLGLIVLARLAAGSSRADAFQFGAAALVLVAGVLGVACVAPDTNSGATAFLSRQPVKPVGVLGLKVLAALAWLFPCAVVAGAIAAAGTPPELRFAITMILGGVIPVFVFGAGLLASVVAFRTMPAILLTPAIALLATTVAIGVPAVWLDLIPPTPQFLSATLLGLGVTFVGVAFVAFARGESHRVSGRPAAFAVAGVGPMLVLGLATTSVAHGWTVESVVPELEVCFGSAESERHVAVPIQGHCWTGSELRVALVDRASLETWVIPARGVWNPEFDPSGERLLVRNLLQPGGWLVDVEGKTATPLPGRSKEGFGYPHLSWREHGPLLLRASPGSIQVFDPVRNQAWAARQPTPGWFVGVSPSDGRVIYRDREGVFAIDVPDSRGSALSATRLLSWADADLQAFASEAVTDVYGFADVVLSPSGAHLLCRWGAFGMDPVVYSLDPAFPARTVLSGLARADGEPAPGRVPDRAELSIREGARIVSQATEPLQGFGSYAYGFSPSGERLLIERNNGPALLADLALGKTQIVAQECRSFPGRPVVWSPDGATAVLPSRIAVDARSGSTTHSGRVVAFLDPERVVRPSAPLASEAWGGTARTLLLQEGGAQ